MTGKGKSTKHKAQSLKFIDQSDKPKAKRTRGGEILQRPHIIPLTGAMWFFTCFLMFGICSGIQAQSLPVGIPVLEDHFRREQLLGNRDSSLSLMIRPLSKDAALAEGINTYRQLTETDTLVLLPFTWIQQLNSHHPYGWNDGSMIAAKGYQTTFSGGIAADYGPMSIQIKPEFTFAANPRYEGYPQDGYPVVWRDYYQFYNNIDLPERNGSSRYMRIDPGQSSIKYNYKEFSLGASTENLWWGPGERNSLLMSNTAPGFIHLTLNTNKPFQTKIGSFEGQFVWGRLDGTNYSPTQIKDYLFAMSNLYAPKKDEWRHFSGITITYQPKWLPGLFAGFARSSQVYNDDVNSIGDVLPFFSSFGRGIDEAKPVGSPDRYTSLFFRWLMKEANAEFYFEYGHNDQSKTFPDFVKNPDAGRAYIFGVKKIFTLSSDEQHIMASVELSQLGQNQESELFLNPNSWYIDENVRHGYTNRGQMLGAGIGPGAEIQSLEVLWFKGLKSIGLQLERNVHNQDYFFYTYTPSFDFRRHWVDMGYSAIGSWDFKNIVVNAKLAAIKSLNYQWFLFQEPGDPYWMKGRDRFNFHARVGVSYFFK